MTDTGTVALQSHFGVFDTRLVAELDPRNGEDAAENPARAAAALRANADLRAVYAAIEAARGRLVQARLWPNPELSLTGASDFAFQNEGERRFGGGFAQRFPIAGRLARARDVARVDVAAALAQGERFDEAMIVRGSLERLVP